MVFISTVCVEIEMFPVSVKATSDAMVIYEILFDGIHPTT